MKEIFKKLTKKGFFHIFGANVINKIFQFGNGIFLVRLLSKSEFGSYSYAQNILNLFLLFNGLGVLYALLQFGSEKKDKRNAIYKYGFKIGFCFNTIITIVLILFSLYADFPNRQTKLALLIMAFMPFSIFGFEFIQNYLRSGLRNIEFSKLSSLNTFLICILSILGAFIYGLIGVIFGQYLAYFISIIIGFIFIWKNINISESERLCGRERKEFMEYSILSMFSNAVSQIVYLIDIFLIGLLISDADLIATYKTATLIPFALNFIPLSIMTFIYPYFAENRENRDWIKENLIKLKKYLFGFNLIITMILIIGAPLFIQVLFGKNYSDSVLLFRILCIGYLIGGSFRIPAGNVLAMMRNVKFLFIANTVIGIINICLDFILINDFSAIGAAISTVSVILLSSVIYNLYLYRLIKN